jgi:hypothetical protein
MRPIYHAQLALTTTVNEHPRALELAEISRALDAMPTALVGVHNDLLRHGTRKADAKHGREGMTAEQVVRIALVKQMFMFSYEELEFHLSDSLQLRAFCRLSPSREPPSRSALQANIGAIGAETWKAFNEELVGHARALKVEDGSWMRTDTTVVESNIHHPIDSLLLSAHPGSGWAVDSRGGATHGECSRHTQLRSTLLAAGVPGQGVFVGERGCADSCHAPERVDEGHCAVSATAWIELPVDG